MSTCGIGIDAIREHNADWSAVDFNFPRYRYSKSYSCRFRQKLQRRGSIPGCACSSTCLVLALSLEAAGHGVFTSVRICADAAVEYVRHIRARNKAVCVNFCIACGLIPNGSPGGCRAGIKQHSIADDIDCAGVAHDGAQSCTVLLRHGAEQERGHDLDVRRPGGLPHLRLVNAIWLQSRFQMTFTAIRPTLVVGLLSAKQSSVDDLRRESLVRADKPSQPANSQQEAANSAIDVSARD